MCTEFISFGLTDSVCLQWNEYTTQSKLNKSNNIRISKEWRSKHKENAILMENSSEKSYADELKTSDIEYQVAYTDKQIYNAA